VVTQAAEQGNGKGQYNLGMMYYNGKRPAELREAMMWYRKAAEQDSPKHSTTSV